MTKLFDLNARFVYNRDPSEKWKILKDDGYVFGDCEDYSLTLAWLLADKSMWRFWWGILTFKYVLWYCHSPRGNGHVIMWVRGRGWVDNIQKRWVTRQFLRNRGYKLKFPHNILTVIIKFVIH